MSELFRICRFPFVFDWACVMSKPNRERNITNKFSDLTFPHQCQVTSLKPARNRMSIVNIFFSQLQHNYHIDWWRIDSINAMRTQQNSTTDSVRAPFLANNLGYTHRNSREVTVMWVKGEKKYLLKIVCVCEQFFALLHLSIFICFGKDSHLIRKNFQFWYT